MKKINRPNVLVIYTDQQRFDSLKCNGNDLAITPNIDRLAKTGVNLQNYFVQNPVCAPSRMSMLTGRYCSSIGIGDNGYDFPESRAMPISNLIKQYGYHTAQIGKLHFNPHCNHNHKNPTKSYGFDTFILSDEPGCYDDAYTKWIESIDKSQLKNARTSLPPAAYAFDLPCYSNVPRETNEPYNFEADENFTHSKFVASETCRFIEENKENRFFAIAGFYAPHPPINPPKRFVDQFDISKMPLPKRGKDEKISPCLNDMSNTDWQKVIAYYYALVSHVDDCVGDIIQTLKTQNLYDNTLIIFTSDHGEYLGDHGRIQKGMPGEDCITRVPCIFSYPAELEQNVKKNAIVEAVDIVPTILDICGIQIPSFVQGISIKNLLTGKTATHKDAALTESFDNKGNKSATIRTDNFRYFVSSSGEEKLFDLVKDPYELTNVVFQSTYSKKLSEIRQLLICKLFKAGFYEPIKIAPY